MCNNSPLTFKREISIFTLNRKKKDNNSFKTYKVSFLNKLLIILFAILFRLFVEHNKFR